MITRRKILVAPVTIVTARLIADPASAQAVRHARVGYLSGGPGDTRSYSVDVFIEALRDLGWDREKNLEIIERFADGDFATLPELARELVAQRPDVIVATGSTETMSLRAATSEIPIVFMQVADPVAIGVVERISRPGRNITGLAQGPQILWGKRLELLTELIGHRPRRLAWIANPKNSGTEAAWADICDAAGRADAQVVRIEISSEKEIDRALYGIKDCDALLVQWDFLFARFRTRIAELAEASRLPAIYENRVQVIAGGLLSYGADLRDNYRQGALYVHRILQGTRPGDLPVIQASRFELVINLTTAKTLGLTIPPSLLARADEVIE